MALTAADATDRADQLTALTAQLTARLTAETRAFEARRPQDAAAGLPETQRLANLYRHESTRVRREPALLTGIDRARRERLVTATVAFEATLARHARALEAARTVTEGLVQAMATAVADARPQAAGYGPRALAARSASSAVALNRRA